MSSGRDGDTPSLLFRQVIELGLAVVDLADPMDLPRQEQDPLRNGCLTGVDMSLGGRLRQGSGAR